jgi:hypothetical protein
VTSDGAVPRCPEKKTSGFILRPNGMTASTLAANGFGGSGSPSSPTPPLLLFFGSAKAGRPQRVGGVGKGARALAWAFIAGVRSWRPMNGGGSCGDTWCQSEGAELGLLASLARRGGAGNPDFEIGWSKGGWPWRHGAGLPPLASAR